MPAFLLRTSEHLVSKKTLVRDAGV